MDPQGEEREANFGGFSIFLLAKSAQNSYGVKTGDYYRYRRYCSRKVTKLRKVMEYKYGNRTKFIKKDIIADKIDDKRVLQIAMFNCQKYWAFANQYKFAESIKQEHKLRAKFAAIKKFKKSAQWSEKLLAVCQKRTNNTTILEAKAYNLYMQGLLSFEKQEWKEAQSNLIGCRQILKDLLSNIDTISEKIYRDKIDQIDQTIKFCNFKISKGKQMPIEQIIQMLKVGDPNLSNLIGNITEMRLQKMSIDSSGLEIKFNNERYPMKDEKIILQKSKIDLQLGNLQIIKSKIEIGDDQLYEQLLNFYSGVVILVDEAIKMVDVQKEDTKNNTQGEIEVFKKVSLLFQEIKLNLLADRNNTIFKHSYMGEKGRKNTPQLLAKLLSNTISIYGQLAEIQKQINEGNDLAPQKIRAIDGKIFLLRSYRLLFVGEVYYNNDKIKQAYSLWKQCQRCLLTIMSSKQSQDLDLLNNHEAIEQVKIWKLKCTIQNYKLNEFPKENLSKQMKELKISEQIAEKNKTNTTLYDLIIGNVSPDQIDLTLAEYADLELIDLPGKVQPIPTRPIFYDIFEAEIAYPSLESKMQKSQKGGWWGKLFGK